MTVSPEHFFRIAISEETAFKTASTYVNPRGLKRGSAVSPGRETIAIENSFNSFGDRYAAIPGAQTYTASISWYLTASWYTDLADVFEAALGTKDTTASPTFSSSADNFTVTVSAPSVAASIMRFVSNEGTPKTYICPVDTDAAGVLTLGVGLPAGSIATACVNPGSVTGAVFEYSLGAAATTFSIESDWSATPSSTTQEVILASGCGITSFQLSYERGGPLTINTVWIGASYTQGGGAAVNTANATAWTAEGPAWQADWFLSTDTTLHWTDTKAAIKSLVIEMAPPLIIETGSQGLDGGSTASSLLPGSDITGYTRDAAFEGLVTIRVPYNKQYMIDFNAQTAFRLFGVMYPGVAGGVAIGNIRTALSIRRMIPVGRPTVVVDAGGRYHELTFQIERSTATNSIAPSIALARFNS